MGILRMLSIWIMANPGFSLVRYAHRLYSVVLFRMPLKRIVVMLVTVADFQDLITDVMWILDSFLTCVDHF